MGDLVKVRVDLLLEIDPKAYNAEYGENKSKREIANDVREAVFNTLDAAFPYRGAGYAPIIVKAELKNRP